MLSTTEIVTLILALMVNIPVYLSLRSQFAKDKIAVATAKDDADNDRMEMSRKLMADAVALLSPLKEQIRDLQVESDRRDKIIEEHRRLLAMQDKKIRQLTDGVGKLIAQIKALDLVPVWTPPELNQDL